MPRASQHPITKEVDKEIKDSFASLISSLNKTSEINSFFDNFLTREETTMLTKRIMLHLMLQREYKNSQIQSFLGITKDTVRLHRLIWEKSSPEYKTILNKIAKKTEIRQFWNNLDNYLKPLELAVKSRSDMKARAKFISGEWD